MTVILELPSELVTRVKSQAESLGLTLEAYLEYVIKQAAMPTTGEDLIEIWERDGVLGAWANRVDIKDSLEFAHDLRRVAETRQKVLHDCAGYRYSD